MRMEMLNCINVVKSACQPIFILDRKRYNVKNKIIDIILAFAVACFTGCSANTASNNISSGTETISRPADQAPLSTPVRFCSFSPNRECQKTAGKGKQPLNNYTYRFRPSSLKCTDKSGLDGLQADK